MSHDLKNNPKQLRVIKTARTETAINEAARCGFWPLVKKVEASPEIRSKFAIWQNRITGEIEVDGDFRANYGHEEWEQVVDWTFYYPVKFESPFAAYLVPADLKVGERVFIEDLIEDLVGMVWNQGNAYRLESSEAIWTGNDFEIQYERKNARFVIG